MIVLGADTHKRSHTIAAVAAVTGELLGQQTIPVGRRGVRRAAAMRSLDGERVRALEDCRHVSGALERFLIERGERVVRIPTRLSAAARRSARQRGNSEAIDARNVARAALQEGLECFPAAHLDGPELDLGRSLTTANGLSAIASSSTARCSGICTTSGLSCGCRAERCSRKVVRAHQSAPSPRAAVDARPDRAR